MLLIRQHFYGGYIVNPFEWPWLPKAILSLAFVIPAWLSIGFFEKTFHVRGEVTAIWYFFGTSLGTFAILRMGNLVSLTEAIPPLKILLAIIGVGVLFGSVTNALLFSAIASASASGANPAIPQAIQGTSVLFVFLLSFLLAILYPAYFSAVSFSAKHLIGIILTLTGIVLMLSRN